MIAVSSMTCRPAAAAEMLQCVRKLALLCTPLNTVNSSCTRSIRPVFAGQGLRPGELGIDHLSSECSRGRPQFGQDKVLGNCSMLRGSYVNHDARQTVSDVMQEPGKVTEIVIYIHLFSRSGVGLIMKIIFNYYAPYMRFGWLV